MGCCLTSVAECAYSAQTNDGSSPCEMAVVDFPTATERRRTPTPTTSSRGEPAATPTFRMPCCYVGSTTDWFTKADGTYVRCAVATRQRALRSSRGRSVNGWKAGHGDRESHPRH